MKIEEFEKDNDSIIVMLHGANFVHTFGRQYSLAADFHLIIPHIMGFGDEAERVFDTETCITELAEYISGLGEKVLLVGFSLGAQLAFKLVSEYPDLFYAAVIVSPWLIKSESELSEAMKINEQQFASLQKRWLCNIVGMMDGKPKGHRKEFVEQMQKVSIQTIRNSVDNGITFESEPGFADVAIPVAALAGAREQQSMIDSVQKMAEINPHCRYEIWEKAAHNIPPVFAKDFNALITSMTR